MTNKFDIKYDENSSKEFWVTYRDDMIVISGNRTTNEYSGHIMGGNILGRGIKLCDIIDECNMYLSKKYWGSGQVLILTESMLEEVYLKETERFRIVRPDYSVEVIDERILPLNFDAMDDDDYKVTTCIGSYNIWQRDSSGLWQCDVYNMANDRNRTEFTDRVDSVEEGIQRCNNHYKTVLKTMLLETSKPKAKALTWKSLKEGKLHVAEVSDTHQARITYAEYKDWSGWEAEISPSRYEDRNRGVIPISHHKDLDYIKGMCQTEADTIANEYVRKYIEFPKGAL